MLSSAPYAHDFPSHHAPAPDRRHRHGTRRPSRAAGASVLLLRSQVALDRAVAVRLRLRAGGRARRSDDVLRRAAGRRRVEDDERRHDLEADLRRRARRVGRRRRGRAVGSEDAFTSVPAISRAGRSRPARGCTSRPTPAGRGRTSVSPLPIHRRNRRRSEERGPRRGRGAGRPRGGAARRRLPRPSRMASAACIARPTAAARGRARCRRTDRPARPTSTWIIGDPQIVYALLGGGAAGAAPQPAVAGPVPTSRPTAARRGSRSAAADCRTARASRRSRCRPARTAGGCTPSRASAQDAARGRIADCIDRTTAARAGRSVRASSRAQAARSTLTRKIPT